MEPEDYAEQDDSAATDANAMIASPAELHGDMQDESSPNLLEHDDDMSSPAEAEAEADQMEVQQQQQQQQHSSPSVFTPGNAAKEAAAAMMLMTTTTTATTCAYDFNEADNEPITKTPSSKARNAKIKKDVPKRRLRRISRPQHSSKTQNCAGKAQMQPKKKKNLKMKRKQANVPSARTASSSAVAVVAIRRSRRSRPTKN